MNDTLLVEGIFDDKLLRWTFAPRLIGRLTDMLVRLLGKWLDHSTASESIQTPDTTLYLYSS